jgi:hypothetical protein
LDVKHTKESLQKQQEWMLKGLAEGLDRDVDHGEIQCGFICADLGEAGRFAMGVVAARILAACAVGFSSGTSQSNHVPPSLAPSLACLRNNTE